MSIKTLIFHFYKWLVGLLGLSLLGLIMLNLTPVHADHPTFFFSSSASCYAPVTTMNLSLGDQPVLYVCLDAENEGQGFLGAETSIRYPTTSSSASHVSCGLFDTCVDLSEEGAIKFLAASGPLPEGKAAASQEAFGHFTLSLKALGTTVLNFERAQIINEREAVEARTGLGLTITVGQSSETVEEVIQFPEEAKEAAEEDNDESGENVMTETIEEVAIFPESGSPETPEPLPETSRVSAVVSSPLSSQVPAGTLLQIVSRVDYTGKRPSQNITSCFPCPTANNPAQGTTTYHLISGPGHFTGSKVQVHANAEPGDRIVFNTRFDDAVSGTNGLSANVSITVIDDNPDDEDEVDTHDPAVIPEPPSEESLPEGTAESEEVPTPSFHPVAPDFLEEAERVLRQLPSQRPSNLYVPASPDSQLCLSSTKDNADSDQDGLSDRTECYLGTDPDLTDTDRDDCLDGDEVNLFDSNPLEFGDCQLQEIALEQVIITDPKPDWIVKSFDISGITPLRSDRVGITAFPASYRTLKPVIDDLDALNEQGQETDAIESLLATLEKDLFDLNAFLDEFGDEYETLPNLCIELTDTLSHGQRAILNAPDDIEYFLKRFKQYLSPPVFLGTVTELKEISLGDMQSASFHLIPESEMQDGVYYLVATALLNDETLLSSAPVRATLDSMVSVDAPLPQYLDGISIRDQETIRVANGRPLLVGQTHYGVQLFATWESLILASSIIADSEEGLFGIQPPRELERDLDHRVTLFAVSQQEQGMVRSESVLVHFRVADAPFNYIVWTALLIILLALAAFVAKRRMNRIDHIAPEHRAKENELYEAFGLEKTHEESMPKDHEKKLKEVEQAFAQPSSEDENKG